MKNLKNKVFGLLIMSAFMIMPMVSSAILDSSLTGEAVAGVDAGVTTDKEASLVKEDSIVNLDTDLDTGVELDLGSDSDVKEGELKNETSSNNSLKINSSGIAVVSSSQVNSESDLEVFSSNISAEEEGVSKVEIDSDEKGESKVEVVYKHTGKFLGLFPVNLKSTTTVLSKSDSEVVVKTKMPWWNFLVAKVDYSKADLKSRIEDNATVKVNAKVNASAESKAKIAEAVISEVRVSAKTEASLNNK